MTEKQWKRVLIVYTVLCISIDFPNRDGAVWETMGIVVVVVKREERVPFGARF